MEHAQSWGKMMQHLQDPRHQTSRVVAAMVGLHKSKQAWRWLASKKTPAIQRHAPARGIAWLTALCWYPWLGSILCTHSYTTIRRAMQNNAWSTTSRWMAVPVMTRILVSLEHPPMNSISPTQCSLGKCMSLNEADMDLHLVRMGFLEWKKLIAANVIFLHMAFTCTACLSGWWWGQTGRFRGAVRRQVTAPKLYMIPPCRSQGVSMMLTLHFPAPEIRSEKRCS